MTKKIEGALLHEMWHSDGRLDALRFALECQGNLDQLRAKISEVQECISNPPVALKDRMKPGASTRVYQDGYLAGLKDALNVIEEATQEVVRKVVVAHQA